MKKNFQTTLIMAGIFVALVAWFLLYEQKVRPKQAETEEKAKQIITLKADEIQEFAVEWMTNAPGDMDPLGALPNEPKFEKLSMKKTAAEWSMTSPVEDAGDTTTANSELSTLASAKWERVVDEDPKDLKQYALDPPIVKIKVQKNSSTPAETILVGRNTPTGFGIYFKFEGRKPVYKGVRALRTSFDKGVKHFRNKLILTNVPRADISEIDIERGKESIVLIKEKKEGDKEEWSLAREHLPAEILEVQKLLNGIVDSKAMDFADNEGKNLEKFGLAKPGFKVNVVHGIDKSRKTILVGTKDNKFYAKREDKPFVYMIDKDTYGKLDRTAQSFRSMRLANFNRFNVKRIKIDKGPESIELLKEEKGWTLPTKPEFKVDGAKVDNLLTTVQDSKITQYLFGQKPDKVANPKLSLQIFEKTDGKEAETVSLKFASNASAKNYIGARKDLDFPFYLKDEDFKKMNVSLKDIEKKEETKSDKPTEHHEGDGHDHGHGHGHDEKPAPSKKT